MDLLWWFYIWRWNQHFTSLWRDSTIHPICLWHSLEILFIFVFFPQLTFPLFYSINFPFTFLPLVSWPFFPECLPSPGSSHCLTWFLSPSIFIWQGTLGIVFSLFLCWGDRHQRKSKFICGKYASLLENKGLGLDQSILNFLWQQLTCWQCSILNTLPWVSLKDAGHMHSQCA